MATGVSFGTRRALGKRYSIDPAIQLEAERLQNEYALIPGREARALEERRIANEEDARSQAGMAGMVGTAGNLLTTGGLIRAMTKAPGEPFFVNPFATKAAGASLTGATGTAGSTGSSFLSGAPKFAVDPALMDTTASGVSAAGTTAAEGTGMMAGLKSAMAYVPHVAAVYAGSKILRGLTGESTLVNRALKPVTDVIEAPFKWIGDFVSDIFGW